MSKSWFSRMINDIKGAGPVSYRPANDEIFDEEPAAKHLWIPYTITAILILAMIALIVVPLIIYF